MRAVVGLHAPDRGDDVAVDPVGLLHRVEDRAVLREDGAAVRDALLADQEVEIVPERLGEFGLGVEQIHDPQIRRQAGDIGVEHRAADAAALGLRPQPLEAAAEISRSRADRLRRHQRMAGGAGLAAPFRRRVGAAAAAARRLERRRWSRAAQTARGCPGPARVPAPRARPWPKLRRTGASVGQMSP